MLAVLKRVFFFSLLASFLSTVECSPLAYAPTAANSSRLSTSVEPAQRPLTILSLSESALTALIISFILFVIICSLVVYYYLYRRAGPKQVGLAVEHQNLPRRPSEVQRSSQQANLKNMVPQESPLSPHDHRVIATFGSKAWRITPVVFKDDASARIVCKENGIVELTCEPDKEISSLSNIPLKVRGEGVLRSYFEVTILDLPATSVISLGLCTPNYPSFKLCGGNNYSLGFHSNSGKIYQTASSNVADLISQGEFYDQPFGVGDVIGCGFDGDAVFFTRNGKLLPVASSYFAGRFPCLLANVGSSGNATVKVNFGTEPLSFQWPKKN